MPRRKSSALGRAGSARNTFAHSSGGGVPRWRSPALAPAPGPGPARPLTPLGGPMAAPVPQAAGWRFPAVLQVGQRRCDRGSPGHQPRVRSANSLAHHVESKAGRRLRQWAAGHGGGDRRFQAAITSASAAAVPSAGRPPSPRRRRCRALGSLGAGPAAEQQAIGRPSRNVRCPDLLPFRAGVVLRADQGSPGPAIVMAAFSDRRWSRGKIQYVHGMQGQHIDQGSEPAPAEPHDLKTAADPGATPVLAAPASAAPAGRSRSGDQHPEDFSPQHRRAPHPHQKTGAADQQAHSQVSHLLLDGSSPSQPGAPQAVGKQHKGPRSAPIRAEPAQAPATRRASNRSAQPLAQFCSKARGQRQGQSEQGSNPPAGNRGRPRAGRCGGPGRPFPPASGALARAQIAGGRVHGCGIPGGPVAG